MTPFFGPLVGAIWIAWLASWQAAALWRSKPSVKAPRRAYRLHFAIVAAGFLLVFGVVPRFEVPLWTVTPALGWTMIALALAGVALAWWARIHLGKLWSGGIERMAEHRVVESGPYALVRHPIYTGLIAAMAATAGIRSTPLALAGVVLFALGFALKARVEERFLEAELGGYDDYRRRVLMLVPLPRRG